jgi:uncharacterized protein (TIGR02145 family)
MKKLLYFAVIAALSVFTACEKEPETDGQENEGSETVAVTGITFGGNAVSDETVDFSPSGPNGEAATITLVAGGESVILTPTVAPSNATNKRITWESDNTDVAVVLRGIVTPLAEGDATITATTVDGSFEAKCEVTVLARDNGEIAVTDVKLSKTELTLIAGGASETLIAIVNPINATNKNVTWESRNTAVATVVNGVVTPVAEGKTAIVVTTVDGGRQAGCNVTVQAAGTQIAVTSITVNPGASVLRIGQTVQLVASVWPDNATNKNVSWSSSNPSIARVDENGLVTAVENGDASITVTAEDGGIKSKPIAISVTENHARRCLTGTPEWGETLGEVRFATDQTWELGNRIWSDAVGIVGMETKLTYDGTERHKNDNGQTVIDGFKSDYRYNPGYRGALWSWCAVALYAEELCPGDWRAPTREDFIDLDIALGGTGQSLSGTDRVPRYFDEWKGELQGWAPYDSSSMGHPIYSSGTDGMYWGQDEHNEHEGAMLLLIANKGAVNPQNHTGKGVGATLRCVKDK